MDNRELVEELVRIAEELDKYTGQDKNAYIQYWQLQTLIRAVEDIEQGNQESVASRWQERLKDVLINLDEIGL